MDLRARSARADVGHHPEVVLVAVARNVILRHAGDLEPEILGLVVGMVYRGAKPVAVEPERLRQVIPRPLDRLGLVVVAERPVAEHLEECVVPAVLADVLEVVVLAAGADALLRRGRATEFGRAPAEEDILELVHAGRSRRGASGRPPG